MTKKILALVLAIMMIAALSASAFADDTKGHISIANLQTYDPEGAETYTAFKIFDVTYSGTSYAYTIGSTSPWLTTVQTYFDTVAAAADGTVLSVSPKSGYSAAAFAAALKTAYASMDPKPEGTALAGSGAEDLDLGYWFVMTNIGTLCNLTTTDPDVTIYDKNEPAPFDKKETSATITGSVQIGTVIPYEITGKVPSTTGYSTYTYKVSDTITGAAFKKDAIVKFGTDTITPSTTELTQTDTGFTLNLDMTLYQEHVGKDISITYSAVVDGSSLTAGEVANTATLQHSNDPGSSSTLKTEPAVKVVTKTFTIDLTKVAEDGTTPLSGAEFVLKNAAGKYYTYADSTGVTWVDSEDNATKVTTGDDGKGDVEFKGLEAGSYSLIEIDSPSGYKLPSSAFAVVITEGTAHIDVDDSTGNVTKWYEYSATVGGETAAISDLNAVAATIENVAGQELPETGGIGTTLFYVLGSVFVIGAAVVLLTKKRA